MSGEDLANVNIRESQVHPELVPTHLQAGAEAVRAAGDAPLDVPGASPPHAGDQDDVIEEEETAVLPDPGTGAGGDEVVAEERPGRGNEVVVSEAVYEDLELPELLLPDFLLVALLLHVIDLQRQLVDLFLRPPQEREVRVVLLCVLHQSLEQQTVPRDPLKRLSQEVREAQPLHLPPPHVLQEPVKCRLGGPRDLDGVIRSLDIADESRVGINHNLLCELNKYQCQSYNWSHTRPHSRCPGTSLR